MLLTFRSFVQCSSTNLALAAAAMMLFAYMCTTQWVKDKDYVWAEEISIIGFVGSGMMGKFVLCQLVGIFCQHSVYPAPLQRSCLPHFGQDTHRVTTLSRRNTIPC